MNQEIQPLFEVDAMKVAVGSTPDPEVAAALAVLVLVEKVLPAGRWLGRAAGAALISWEIATSLYEHCPLASGNQVGDALPAALDSRTEEIIQTELERIAEDRTTLVIAHRLSTVIDADRSWSWKAAASSSEAATGNSWRAAQCTPACGRSGSRKRPSRPPSRPFRGG